MIQLRFLSKANIGEWVIYRKGTDEQERGRIKGFNHESIFVVYKCNNEWHRFQDFTAAATDPADLTFENAATSLG
jgi:hypothetical protein